MSILDQLKSVRTNLQTEREVFTSHIKRWFPVAILIGIAVGTAMTLFFVFTILVSEALGLFHPVLGMAIGGLIIWLMVRVGFEDPRNNGISYVIQKKHEHQPVPLSQTQEFVSAGITIGSGLPVGREGPALIVGSAIASWIAKKRNFKPVELHDAITLGSAAATGALFQAPFGSAVFATEVPYKEDSDEPMLMGSFLASVVAAVTMRSLIVLINNNLFTIDLHLFRIGDAVLDITVLNALLAFLIGILIGILGRGIILIYYKYKSLMTRFFTPQMQILTGLGISLISILLGLLIIEDLYIADGISSFDAITNFIGLEDTNLVWILVVAIIIQIIATVAIIAVGFPGGIFTPSLAIGALSGILFANILGITNLLIITAWAIVGMSASHAASTKTPIASILLVLEITNMPNLIIPIILANISAYIVSGHKSLYEGQIRSRDSSILKQLSQYDQFEELSVEQIMTRDEKVIFATPGMELVDIREISHESNKKTFPVLDDEKVVGVISIGDILRGINMGKQIVREVMTENVISVQKNMTAREALLIILNNDVERVPVTNENNELEGFLTQGDIFRGHQKMIDLQKRVR